ncbi:helix-turn-helix domain-containing protein [Pseudoxanthomonas kaohsiungensis]|uniref:Helix-turn-helix domain-containing protein n=1 Tax=Pseudoxanthomonas kaohsiungensis TaxID=283923 RepID=A0ABW3LVD1_9GAMM|nr:helix-turn-helix transcriptional regulator [Pseudoxanthomonas kaohsiungensis]KAF1705175.1 transcriptional regulator [Pseudoxanthomonas kaohsiungensis]
MAAKTIYSEAYRQLVQDLRTLREQAGWSQTALSHEMGWPQQRLSAVEAGARRLDVLEFLQLVRALGLTPEAGIGLVTRAEAKAPASRPAKRDR